MKFGPSFVWTSQWNPVTGQFGALPAIAGTLTTSLIAIVLAVPLSFAIAIFITQTAPEWMQPPIGIAIELLAAIPSIIYGIWGLFIFAPVFAQYVETPVTDLFSNVPILSTIFAGPPIGIGMMTASIILAIMILPFIAAVMRDVIDTVPARSQGERLRDRRHQMGSHAQHHHPGTAGPALPAQSSSVSAGHSARRWPSPSSSATPIG